MAGEFAGKVKFVKYDLTDRGKDYVAATEHDISAIPATVVFKDGKEAARVVGADASDIRSKVEGAL